MSYIGLYMTGEYVHRIPNSILKLRMKCLKC